MQSFNLPIFLSGEYIICTEYVRNSVRTPNNEFTRTERKVTDVSMIPTIRAMLSDPTLMKYTLPFHNTNNVLTLSILHKHNTKINAMDTYVFRVKDDHVLCYLKRSLVVPYDPSPLIAESLQIIAINDADVKFLNTLKSHTKPLTKRERCRYEAIKKRVAKKK